MNYLTSLNDQRVIIICAGPAGLTAAYELSTLGLQSVILEADSRFGGISRTVNYQGYRFDIGGHRFFSKIPYINQLWQNILGDDFISCSRLSRIYYQGYFFDYPINPFNAFLGFGVSESVKIFLNYIKSYSAKILASLIIFLFIISTLLERKLKFKFNIYLLILIIFFSLALISAILTYGNYNYSLRHFPCFIL